MFLMVRVTSEFPLFLIEIYYLGGPKSGSGVKNIFQPFLAEKQGGHFLRFFLTPGVKKNRFFDGQGDVRIFTFSDQNPLVGGS